MFGYDLLLLFVEVFSERQPVLTPNQTPRSTPGKKRLAIKARTVHLRWYGDKAGW